VTRWVSGANAAAAAKPSVVMVTLVDLWFPTGTLYLCDGLGTLSFGGNTYSGIGDYGRVETIDESTETMAKSVTLTLAGVPATLLTDVITENYQGRLVTIWIGMLNPNTLAWIDTPEMIWEGRMDYVVVGMTQGKSEIKLLCEHRLNIQPPVARYTDQDQQLAHPGDTYFDLTWQIPQASASWGSITVQHPATVPPYGAGVGGGRGGRSGGSKP